MSEYDRFLGKDILPAGGKTQSRVVTAGLDGDVHGGPERSGREMDGQRTKRRETGEERNTLVGAAGDARVKMVKRKALAT